MSSAKDALKIDKKLGEQFRILKEKGTEAIFRVDTLIVAWIAPLFI